MRIASAARSGLRPRSGDLPTLSQWYHEYGEEGTQEAVERYADMYEDANVEVEWVPGDYTTAVTSALLTDEGPDVFEFGNGPSIDMIQGGQVVPLDGILGDAESDFNERMIQRLTYDGHLWAVPQVIDMQLLVYRKSMLEEAGVTLPIPLTLDALIDAAAQLTTGDTKGVVPRQRRRRRRARRAAAVVGRRRLPHRGQPAGLHQRGGVRLVRQGPRAVRQRLAAARRADGLVRSGRLRSTG